MYGKVITPLFYVRVAHKTMVWLLIRVLMCVKSWSWLIYEYDKHNIPWKIHTYIFRFTSLALRQSHDCPSSHYNNVIMGTIASQITSITTVYSTIYSDADRRKHQSSVSLAFVRGIHRRQLNSPHKWPVTRKMFPFDDVTMQRRNPEVHKSLDSLSQQNVNRVHMSLGKYHTSFNYWHDNITAVK